MSTMQEMGRVSKKPFIPRLQLKEEFSIPQRPELKAIGVFKITYYPRAYVELVARSRWGLTSKSTKPRL